MFRARGEAPTRHVDRRPGTRSDCRSTGRCRTTGRCTTRWSCLLCVLSCSARCRPWTRHSDDHARVPQLPPPQTTHTHMTHRTRTQALPCATSSGRVHSQSHTHAQFHTHHTRTRAHDLDHARRHLAHRERHDARALAGQTRDVDLRAHESAWSVSRVDERAPAAHGSIWRVTISTHPSVCGTCAMIEKSCTPVSKFHFYAEVTLARRR